MRFLESPVFLIIPYIVFCVFIGFLGKNKKIGRLNATVILVFISLTLTPLGGLIFLFFAKTPDPFEEENKKLRKLYECENCGWKFEKKYDYCPHCNAAMDNLLFPKL